MPLRTLSRDYRRIFADAAWELGSTRGSSALTVRAIASHVDVSPGLIYAHFEDKAALLAELHRIAAGRLTIVLDAVPEHGDLHERLVAISRAYVEFAHAHAWLTDHGQAELAPPCDMPELRRVFEACVRPHLESHAEAAQHLWLGVHGFAQLTSFGRSSAALGEDPGVIGVHTRMIVRGLLRMPA